MQLTVMVKNIHSEWLSVDMVLALYSLRWQIEVLFKQIKSQLNIDKIDTSKEHRCRCEIIGRIIMCVLLHRIHGQLNTTTWNSKRREVSMKKLYKRLGERSQIIINKIKNSYHSFICYLSSQLKYLLDFCLKGIQKTRRNILELLEFGPVVNIWWQNELLNLTRMGLASALNETATPINLGNQIWKQRECRICKGDREGRPLTWFIQIEVHCC